MGMPFSRVAECYEKLEKITGRIEMTELLASLIREAPPEEVDKICYLTLGRLAPEFAGIELGIGEKLAVKAISIASGRPLREVQRRYKETGQIGALAEESISKRVSLLAFEEELTVTDAVSYTHLTLPTTERV